MIVMYIQRQDISFKKAFPCRSGLRILRAFFGVCLFCGIAGCGNSTPDKQQTPHSENPVSESSSQTREKSTSPSDPGLTSISLRNVAPDWGIQWTYRNGEEAGLFSILESLGGGIGWFDFDRDGDCDLLATGGGTFPDERSMQGLPNALFQNRGSPSSQGTQTANWIDVAKMAGIHDSAFYSHGVAIGDYDSDGFPDVVVTGYGGLQLFHNLGDGTFEEQSQAAGVVSHRWSGSAAWGDMNQDGFLDLYVANYVDWSFDNNPLCRVNGKPDREICSPRIFQGLTDELFINDGQGAFSEQGKSLGIIDGGKGLGVLAADIDLDGDLDYYVGNDTVRNHFYLNDGSGQLVESGELSGTGYGDSGRPDGSMGVDVGDFNADGKPDICVANYESEDFALYRAYDNAFFQHVSRSTGVTATGTLRVGWGTLFVDLDNDADEDIFSVNGHVIRHPMNAPLRQNSTLLENQSGRRFQEFAPPENSYLTRSHMSRGLAAADIDDDGDLDFAVSNINEPMAVLVNQDTSPHHWIELQLIGTDSTRLPIGASIMIQTEGKPNQLRLQKGGTSYASTNGPRIHVGLGKSSGPVDLVIRWPSGTRQTVSQLEVDHIWLIVESDNSRTEPLALTY